MARGAAAGIMHLHEEGLVHRDIAARNLLVDGDGLTSKPFSYCNLWIHEYTS